jgi:hypothetical protein
MRDAALDPAVLKAADGSAWTPVLDFASGKGWISHGLFYGARKDDFSDWGSTVSEDLEKLGDLEPVPFRLIDGAFSPDDRSAGAVSVSVGNAVCRISGTAGNIRMTSGGEYLDFRFHASKELYPSVSGQSALTALILRRAGLVPPDASWRMVAVGPPGVTFVTVEPGGEERDLEGFIRAYLNNLARPLPLYSSFLKHLKKTGEEGFRAEDYAGLWEKDLLDTKSPYKSIRDCPYRTLLFPAVPGFGAFRDDFLAVYRAVYRRVNI